MSYLLKRCFKFLFLVCLLACRDAQAKLFDAQSFYLDNGLEVVVVSNRRAPIIKQMLCYRSGSIDEKVGKGGSAHLLEHLMFRGTKKISGQKFNRLMEENGAESNAFTSTDVTCYHQFMDISRLELAMFAEADRMNNLQISDTDFELEKGIVYQERKQRIDNSPLALFGEEVRRVLWQNNPYGRPVTGTEEEILGLKKKDIETFYNNYYTPERAVLVLSGNIDVKTAKKLAEKYYGSAENKGEIKNTVDAKVFSELKKIQTKIEMALPDVKTPRLLKMYASSSYQHEAENVYLLQVLAAYMGEGETSKLYKKLVLDEKIALGVSVDYNPLSRSYGIFSISVMPAEEVKIGELEKSLEKAWEEALRELNLDEVQKVKQKMLSGLIYLRDNPEDAAYVVGVMRGIGVALEEIEQQADKIREVNYRDVLSVAKNMIEISPQVTAILYPEGEKNAL